MEESNKPQVDYSLSFLKRPKYIGGFIFLFFFLLLQQISFKNKLDSIIYGQLRAIPGCPITIDNYDMHIISLDILNLKLPAGCAGRKGLTLKKITLSLNGISFSPFGPTFSVDTKLLGNPIAIKELALGLGGIALIIQNESSNGVFEKPNEKISLSSLETLIPNVALTGDIYISDLILNYGYDGSIENFAANITSNNLVIPSQNVSGLALPNLALNQLLIQAKLVEGSEGKKPKISLSNIVLGTDEAPLYANFKGELALNLRRVKNSMIDAKGQVKFSADFLEEFSILNLVLSKFNKEDDYYQIPLKGKLSEVFKPKMPF